MIHKILIIEEDENLSSLFVEYLSTNGFSVVLAKTENEAISKFTSDLDMCIFDLVIENTNALELKAKLNNLVSSMPFVYLYFDDFKTEIKTSDLDEKIKRPFSMNDLLNAVNNIYNK